MTTPNPDLNPDSTTPTDAETWRRSLTWTFTAGPGLNIQFRYLTLSGLVATGALPLPVLTAVEKFWSSDLSLQNALRTEERRTEMLMIARCYVVTAAMAPVIVMTETEARQAPNTLSCEELGDSLVIEMFHEGMRRRMAAVPSVVETFRAAATGSDGPAGHDGETVRPSAKPLVSTLAERQRSTGKRGRAARHR